MKQHGATGSAAAAAIAEASATGPAITATAHRRGAPDVVRLVIPHLQEVTPALPTWAPDPPPANASTRARLEFRPHRLIPLFGKR